MDKLDDLAAPHNASVQAARTNAATPVDLHDPASIARKQAVMKACGSAAKDLMFALAALDRDKRG